MHVLDREKGKMEDIIPPVLSSIREVRWRIACGASMNESMRLHLMHAHSPFTHRLKEWWALKIQGHTRTLAHFPSRYQKAFLQLIERGCAGQPVLEHLRALEDEVAKAADSELDAHVATLPFKMLAPLLLFQFPAFLILLLGPALRELTRQLGA